MAGGRPAKYGAETRAEICKRIASGESLTAICKDEHMPAKHHVLDWLFDEPEFSTQYARAREAQAEHYLEEIIEISDDSMLDTEMGEDGIERTNHEVVARARLRVDTRKWAMSKLAPKKYGDKVQNEHTGKDGAPIEHAVSIAVTFHDPDKAG
jgi:hypothetical protein